MTNQTTPERKDTRQCPFCEKEARVEHVTVEGGEEWLIWTCPCKDVKGELIFWKKYAPFPQVRLFEDPLFPQEEKEELLDDSLKIDVFALRLIQKDLIDGVPRDVVLKRIVRVLEKAEQTAREIKSKLNFKK